MKKIFVILLISSISLGFLSNCRRFKTFEERVEWVTSKLSSKLDLDDEQKKALDKIKLDIIGKKDEIGLNRGKAMEEVIAEIKKDTFDKERVNTIFTSNQEKRDKMRRFFIDKMAEFHTVLRPEQREKLASLMQKFSHKRRKYWGQ
ncbi:MAG: Spy/CpxP family protein refolding chaperone [Spirochaetota bacterium]